MPIEKVGDGFMVTGHGVRTYQLVSLKSALHLFEKTGMRPSRYVHPLKIAQKVTGIKSRNYGKLYAALDALIASSQSKDTGQPQPVRDAVGYTAEAEKNKPKG
jgi:hypothetical protein